MKNLKNITLLTLVLALFSFVNLKAQNPASPSKTATVVIKTSGECDMCKEKIESTLGKMSGVKKVTLDVATKDVTVEYITKKTSPDKLRKALAEIGYDADDVKANNRAQRDLPACCQPKPKADSTK